MLQNVTTNVSYEKGFFSYEMCLLLMYIHVHLCVFTRMYANEEPYRLKNCRPLTCQLQPARTGPRPFLRVGCPLKYIPPTARAGPRPSLRVGCPRTHPAHRSRRGPPLPARGMPDETHPAHSSRRAPPLPARGMPDQTHPAHSSRRAPPSLRVRCPPNEPCLGPSRPPQCTPPTTSHTRSQPMKFQFRNGLQKTLFGSLPAPQVHPARHTFPAHGIQSRLTMPSLMYRPTR